MPEGLVERDGVRLHYREWPADATRSLLFLPGLGGGGGSSLYWVPVVEAIGKRLRIVSMERRGHAHSDWSESYRWQEVVADINAVVTKLDLAPAILVGHSAGSAWAYLYASEHPDNVHRLVDVDGGAPYPLVDTPPQPPILRTQACDALNECGERP
jgi:pimeloyl-ACP methyl ester carboxylesterase